MKTLRTAEMGHRGPVVAILRYQNLRSGGYRATFQTVSRETVRKGFELRGDGEFGRYAEHEIDQKGLLGSPQGYPASAPETFRTVSRETV
jgi:hypothetical protein